METRGLRLQKLRGTMRRSAALRRSDCESALSRIGIRWADLSDPVQVWAGEKLGSVQMWAGAKPVPMQMWQGCQHAQGAVRKLVNCMVLGGALRAP